MCLKTMYKSQKEIFSHRTYMLKSKYDDKFLKNNLIAQKTRMHSFHVVKIK